MAWTSISNTVPQYSKNAGGAAASGYFLKFYEDGTTTPTVMATNSTGGTTLAKCQLTTLGYPSTDGTNDNIFIPHIDQTYKLALYENETDADNNTLINATWVVDNIDQQLTGDITAYVKFTDLSASNGSTLVTYDQGDASAVDRSVQDRLRDTVSLEDFGAAGDNSTDNTTTIGAWLDHLIANDVAGFVPDGTFLSDYITKAANNGIRIYGNGIIKATGSNRLNHIRFTGVRGKVEIDGVTFDGNNIAARALEIQNTGEVSPGDVWIGPKCKILNSKNTAPDTYTAVGLRVHGWFDTVVFEGEIDGVDSTSTSGAATIGLWTSWTGSGDDWVRRTTVTGNAKIKNVKNDNATTADADGIQATAPTTQMAYFSVDPGAYFENCEGRAIKSQVQGNNIYGPVIFRDAYPGLVEVNLQYAGGNVHGVKVHHAGQYCTSSIIGVTQRPTPANTHCSISENELRVTGSPSQWSNAMIATDVTDASVKCQGITIRDNKVKGTITTMVSSRVANVVDVNRIVVDGNWSESIDSAFLTTSLFGSARAQLTVVFTNNGCENGCTGASITDDLIVEYARNNHNISRLISSPYSSTIATGAVTVYGSTQRINTEGSAATDDLDTINAAGSRTYEPDEHLTLIAANDARTVVLKDGTGNLRLNGDFSLDNIEDRIVLSYDGTNWCEISRSDNGA